MVVGAEGFWVAELRVRQLKIGSKSCFADSFLNINKKYFYSIPKSRKNVTFHQPEIDEILNSI